MRREFRMSKAVMEKMRIPSDLANQEAMLTFWGHHEVSIENYRRIICFREDCLKILLARGTVEFRGSCLHMTHYSKEELHIAGCIKNVFFELP